MILYITEYGLAVLIATIHASSSQSGVHTSKACSGASGLPCTSHRLKCSSGQIAIYDAYFRANSACPLTGLSTCSKDVMNITDVGDRYEFIKTEMMSLYDSCSSRSNCAVRASRSSAGIALSIVKYMCIENTADICTSVSNGSTTDVSFIWKGNSSLAQSNTVCSCEISPQRDGTHISLYALDMRINATQHQCSEIVISYGASGLHFNCSSLISPYQLLANTSQSRHTEVMLNFQEPSRGDRIWIRVQGTDDYSFACSQVFQTSSVTVLTKVSRTPATTSRTTLASGNGGHTEKHPVPSGSVFPGGIFVAGVVAGAAIVSLTGFFLYFAVFRRRYRFKKKGDVPPSVVHPNYAGLTARVPSDIYDALRNENATENANENQSQFAKSAEYQNASFTLQHNDS